jgi:hypothetical protein
LCFAVFGGFAVRLDTALPSTLSLPCTLRGLCRLEVFTMRFSSFFAMPLFFVVRFRAIARQILLCRAHALGNVAPHADM